MASITSPLNVVPGNTPLTMPKNNTEVSMQLDSTLERQLTFEKKPLPNIGRSQTMDGHSDFLPDEVMVALTHQAEPEPKTSVPRERSLAVTSSQAKRPPANVWNHKRKDKFKHLTDQALCFCGAGRDISFLYDVPHTADHKPEEIIANDVSKDRKKERAAQPISLNNTVVPEEYHIVKNKGVIGLEYHKDEYTTQPEDHEAHLTVFPSMKPTSRYEVMRLKEVLDDLMEKSGVNDEEIETVGPTQMHNLVELIKKEQKIYNLVFHELIRQATVECTERGQLLAEIRSKYSDLLNKVPTQIRGLHDEVMAQRALDRRLSDELFRFKEQIILLTEELTEVKEHDSLVTEQAKKAQEDLRSALMESQKNASLLGEYHELYELQRSRLEKLVSILTEEKELWSTATYSLSIKVIEEGNLATSKRAYIAEKAWSKLAHHFTVLLSDKDTEILTRLQGHMEKWRDLMESFHIQIKAMEDDVEASLINTKVQIQKWIEDFKKNCLNKEGAFVKGPSVEKTKTILAEIRSWSLSIQNEIDKFSGHTLLGNNDMLISIEAEISGWTDCGVEVFGRHKRGDDYPNDYKVMVALNKKLREMCQQYSNRVTGENGTAKLLIQLNTAFESWENKLVQILHSGQNVPQRDWMLFMEQMDDWTLTIDKLIQVIGSVDIDDGKKNPDGSNSIDVHEMMRKAHMWSVTTNNSIDSEDSKYVEQVTQLHTNMVKWMVNVLMRLAPDLPNTSREAIENSLVNSPPIADLQDEAWLLFSQLDNFSLLIYRSCEDIVRGRAQDRLTAGDDNPDKELIDLLTLKYEAYHWIYAALILLHELTGELKEYKPIDQRFDMNQFSKARTAETEATSGTPLPDTTVDPEQTLDTLTSEPAVVTESTSQPHEGESVPTSEYFTVTGDTEEGEEKAISRKARKTVGVVATIGVNMSMNSTRGTPPTTSTPQPTEEPVSTEPARSPGHTPRSHQTSRPSSGASGSEPLTSSRQTKTSPRPRPQTLTSGTKDTRPSTDRSLVVGKEEANLSRIEVIGRDDNTRPALLPEPSPDEPPPRPSSGKPMAVDSQKAYDALKTVQKVQNQLIETEVRAQRAEEREAALSKELIETKQEMRALEKLVAELRGGSTPAPEPAVKEPESKTEQIPIEEGDSKEMKSKKSSKPSKSASKKKK